MERYDNYGRMLYNSKYHENQGKAWTEEDKAYLCSMHDAMHRKSLSMALGRTETTVSAKLYYLQKHGEYDYYRKLGKAI